MRAGLLEHFEFIPRKHAALADVYWLKWQRGAYPMHLAIVTEKNYVLHADGEGAKSVVEHVMPQSWNECIVTAMRWKAWANG